MVDLQIPWIFGETDEVGPTLREFVKPQGTMTDARAWRDS